MVTTVGLAVNLPRETGALNWAQLCVGLALIGLGGCLLRGGSESNGDVPPAICARGGFSGGLPPGSPHIAKLRSLVGGKTT